MQSFTNHNLTLLQVVPAFSPSIEEPSTPSPRRARPSLGTARLPSFVPKLALGAMAPSDQSSALSSRQGRPTSRFHPEFVAKTTASANPAASLLLPKLSLAGLQCHTAAPGPSESSRQMLSHRSTPEPGLPVSIMPLSPSLATLPSSVGMCTASLSALTDCMIQDFIRACAQQTS